MTASIATTATGIQRHSHDYRALMTAVDESPVVRPAIDQLGSWLRGKKRWDVDLEKNGRHVEDSRELLVLHHETKYSRSLFARLVEDSGSDGTWTTELTAHDGDDRPSWVSVEVASSKGRFVTVPRLASFLMDAVQLGDGELNFATDAQVFHANRLDELQDLLCDPQRHGVVFVAGTDESLDFGRYLKKVQEWTWQVLGLAQVIVMDPTATRAFRNQFGVTHDVPPWTIRTFMPEADPADPIDARRHRILGSSRLAAMKDAHIRSLLGSIAREQTANRTLPADVIRARRTFERLENQLILKALQSEPKNLSFSSDVELRDEPDVSNEKRDASAGPNDDIAGSASFYLAQIELTKRVLQVDDLDETSLAKIARRASRERVDPEAVARAAAQIDLLQGKIERIEDDLASTRGDLETAYLEHAYTKEESEQLANENRYLRSQLRQDGDFETAFGAVPEEWITDYPVSYEELLERLNSLNEQGLFFTGDSEATLSLSSVDTLDFCLHTAWDTLLTLADYRRARGAGDCDKGVDHYLAHTPHGYRTFPPGKHGSETGETMKRFGDERRFPVPADVDSSGWSTMKWHFKLGKIGKISPRLYYLDDCAGSGDIYVGYIGRHLTNMQTKSL